MPFRYCYGCREVTFFEPSLGAGGAVGCTACGQIDETLSFNAIHRQTLNGISIQDGFELGGIADAELRARQAAEEKLKGVIAARASSWLSWPNNILGLTKSDRLDTSEDGPFVQSIIDIYLLIREAETLGPDGKPYRRATVNSDAERIKYQLAVAIRMAAMQSNLILVYNALGDHGKETLPKGYGGKRAVTHRIIPVPYLKDMATNLGPLDGSNPLRRVSFLHSTYKRFTRLLKRPNDPLHTIMSNCFLVIQRLRAIVDADEEKRKELLVFDKKSSKLFRPWSSGDFDYFREEALDWDKVPLVAYNLYRAQQCVMIWGNSATYLFAIALTLHAVYGLVGSWYPYNTQLIVELAAQYGAVNLQAATAYGNLRRLIIAWSTSLPEIGVRLPRLNLPHKALVGQGCSGWNGDRRRPVPDFEVHVVAILPVAMHWKAIYRSRLERQKVVPYEQELTIARRKFAANTPDLRQRWTPLKGYSRKDVLLQQCEADATDVKVADTPASCAWEIDDDPDISLNDLDAPDPEWYPVAHTALHVSAEIKVMARRQQAEVEALLEQHDSSDEDDGYDSDDEPVRPKIAKQESAGFFGFTMGPEGFERVDADTPSHLARIEIPASFGQEYQPETSPALTRGQSEASDFDAVAESSRASRSLSPAISVSTLHSLNSAIPMSRSMSNTPLAPSVLCVQPDWTPQASIPASQIGQNKAHIATLIRERDEYVPYGADKERDAGRLVSKDIEQYIEGWLAKERARGRMPMHISPEYLASIGLQKDPMVDRIDSWILAQEWRWTPLECVLRAGIPPKQIPSWMVPQSRIAVVRALEHRPDLPAHPAIPECPPIPDWCKADPTKYAAQIQHLKDEWEKDVSDGFPVFFPTHEKLMLIHDDDALFAPGELDMYLADDKEVSARKRDQDFLEMLLEEEPSDRKRKRQERDKAKALAKELEGDTAGDIASTAFWGYERALEDDLWDKVAMGMGIAQDGDETGEWGDDADASDTETVETRKRSASPAGSAGSAQNFRRPPGSAGLATPGETSSAQLGDAPVSHLSALLTPVQLNGLSLASESGGPSITTPKAKRARKNPVSTAASQIASGSCTPKPVGKAGRIPQFADTPTPLDTPESTPEPIAKAPAKPRAKVARKPPRDTTRPARLSCERVVQDRIEDLAHRQDCATQHKVLFYLSIYLWKGVLKLQAAWDAQPSNDEAAKAFQMALEHWRAQKTEGERLKAESKQVAPDPHEVERRIKAWAAERRIGLRELGLGWRAGEGPVVTKKMFKG